MNVQMSKIDNGEPKYVRRFTLSLQYIIGVSVLLIIIILTILTLSGCSNDQQKEDAVSNKSTTMSEYDNEHILDGLSAYGYQDSRVVVDRETGIQYIVISNGGGLMSITPRLNSKGKYMRDNSYSN